MAGIAGIITKDKNVKVHNMLGKISHRGKNHRFIVLKDGLELAVSSNDFRYVQGDGAKGIIYSLPKREDSIGIGMLDGKIYLKRDKFGVDPLYYLYTEEGNIAFASEVKALAGFNKVIRELEPGSILQNGEIKKYFTLEKGKAFNKTEDEIASALREKLVQSIKRRHDKSIKTGAWLSGGLDSSAISALLRPLMKELHTFSVGFKDAPDLEYAKIVADFIGSTHHERIISFEEVIKILPDVIYHLESFDGLLVRSSIMNFLVSEMASQYVDEVFSGEGGDELFAGYEYIKQLPFESIEDELIDITKRLHNTALQRVDRSSSAFGTVAHVPFVDEDVVAFATRIPVEYKLKDGVEKWVLRQALKNDLPSDVLNRTKSKFWEGSGMGKHLFSYAEGLISDAEFEKEKKIKCGWELKSKEELLYYRLFRDKFGDMDNLDWMGRSK